MGIIRKQSIYSSIFTYAGFLIGSLNILVLFKHFFTPEELGLTRLLLDLSILFSTFSTFATLPITIKFFPFYKSYLPDKKNDLPFITFVLCIIGCSLFTIAATLFKVQILRKFGERSPLFLDYYYLLYPMTISLTFLYLFENFAISIKKTVIANIAKEVVFRVTTTFMILLYAFKVISLNAFLNLFAYVYLPSVLLLFIYLFVQKRVQFHFSLSSVTKRLYKRMIPFGTLLFAGGLLNIISRTSDIIFISSQSAAGLKDVAVFTIATYFITIIDVPQRSVIAISTPFIAEAWKDRNIGRILRIYQKTSLNLLLIAFAMSAVILLNADNIFLYFNRQEYNLLKPLLFILLIAKIIDAGTGLNSQILGLSKYWRVDFFTNIFYFFIAIPLSYYLVKKFGVMGSAYANFIALFVFNLMRTIYIYHFFKLQPFTWNLGKAVLIAVLCFVLVYILPFFHTLYLDAFIRVTLFLILYGSSVIKLKISQDVNDMYYDVLKRFKLDKKTM